MSGHLPQERIKVKRIPTIHIEALTCVPMKISELPRPHEYKMNVVKSAPRNSDKRISPAQLVRPTYGREKAVPRIKNQELTSNSNGNFGVLLHEQENEKTDRVQPIAPSFR
jgi:hypothetical protein